MKIKKNIFKTINLGSNNLKENIKTNKKLETSKNSSKEKSNLLLLLYKSNLLLNKSEISKSNNVSKNKNTHRYELLISKIFLRINQIIKNLN